MTIIKAGVRGAESAIKWKFGSRLKCAEMSFDLMSHDVSRFLTVSVFLYIQFPNGASANWMISSPLSYKEKS